MLRITLIIMLGLTLLASFVLAKNIPALLKQANELKQAEKYKSAEKIYDQVLELEPNNPEAKKGKEDCFLMLNPPVPVQHLMVTEIDPEHKELIKKYDAAKTPWDKRRLENEMTRLAVKFTGKVFSRQSDKYELEADKIIARFKANPTALALSNATDQLKQLQERANRSWKGHGPEMLGPALLKLRQNLRDSMLEL